MFSFAGLAWQRAPCRAADAAGVRGAQRAAVVPLPLASPYASKSPWQPNLARLHVLAWQRAPCRAADAAGVRGAQRAAVVPLPLASPCGGAAGRQLQQQQASNTDGE